MATNKKFEGLVRRALATVMRATTPEDVLGVKPGASEADVKREYRELSLLFHPDKLGGGVTAEQASEAMKRLNGARDQLLVEGQGGPAPPRAAPPRPAPPPTVAPAIRVATVDATSATLEWDGRGPFELQYREACFTSWTSAKVAGTVAKKKHLKPSTKYAFRVRTADRAAQRSPWSFEVLATTSAAPAPPPPPPPPVAPATPQKAKRPRAADATPPTPAKAAKTTPGHGRLARARVTLVRKTSYSGGKGGHRCEFRLERDATGFPGRRKVVFFDRLGAMEAVSFDDGAVYLLTASVRPDDYGGSKGLVVRGDVELEDTSDTHRLCEICGEKSISVDEPGWKTKCLDCFIQSKRD